MSVIRHPLRTIGTFLGRYFFNNPVLQRELLVNLRMGRAFVTLFVYLALLGMVVYFAWPQDEKIDMTNPQASRRLVELFFLGQYVLASLMAPTFAAGAITSEKERKTYEMLLASPIHPGAIVAGKLLASLTHLALLIVASLPIVMLCLPLGGTNFYEVLAVYLGLILATTTFGLLSLWCSSYFRRTSAALVVSYLAILPLALLGLAFWHAFASASQLRLLAMVTVLPAVCGCVWAGLLLLVSARLLHPPDVGAEGQEVVDEEHEAQHAVGLVIRRDHFPDRLFAPPKRNSLLPDGANPVYDKEMRAEIFAQGTLMLRLVVQVSMFLAVPLMGFFLFLRPHLAAWYMSYVALFNVLVGPVFSAGAVTGERERQTLELLLTTLLSPAQILWGKFIAGFRVSGVLTLFLLWPVLLACLLVSEYWNCLTTVLQAVLVLAITCLTTALVALFCSVLFRRTSISMMVSYIAILALFAVPVAAEVFAHTLYPTSPVTAAIDRCAPLSPISTLFRLPWPENLDQEADSSLSRNRPASQQPASGWISLLQFAGVYLACDALLLVLMLWLFRQRWRIVY
jgi:ABC-type transport system involved in multi-copper enzyme maturation permease subunit